MKKVCLCFVGLFMFIGARLVAQAKEDSKTLIVAASNTADNWLLVYDTAGNLVQAVSTQGQGGVGGNAGGVVARDNIVAAVNFGSQTVSLFSRKNDGFKLSDTVTTASKPVSVAFGYDHLYVLGLTEVQSYRLHDSKAEHNPDGVVGLVAADGSSAQVGVVLGQLIISEKSNVIESVDLSSNGAVTGSAIAVQNIPANVDTPFGLVTRGNNAYVTIAHADEISLIRNSQVLATTGSGTQHSPCWLTLVDEPVGSFIYSSNSPSHSISRFAVYGQHIVQDSEIAASLIGAPTDIDSGDGFVAVIDGSAGVSRLSIFAVDEDGNLTLDASTTITNAPAANGVAIVTE